MASSTRKGVGASTARVPDPIRREISFIARATWLAAYLVLVVYGSLVPLNYQPMPFVEAVKRFNHLHEFQISVGGRADWVANVLLYVPLGWLMMFCISSRRWPLAAQIVVAFIATMLAIGVAIGVEFLQVWFPPRTVSINDLRAESLGSVIGVVLFGICRFVWPRFAGWWEALYRRSLISALALLYMLFLAIFSIMPCDFILNASELQQKASLGRICVVPFGDASLSVDSVLLLASHVLAFAPIGFWLTYIGAREKSSGDVERRAIWLALVRGTLFGVAIELIQVPVFSRHVSTTAVVSAFVGTLLGGLAYFVAQWARRNLASQWTRRRRCVTNAAWAGCAIYSLLVAIVFLAPFNIVHDPAERELRWRGLFATPFAALYVGSEFQALTNVFHKGAPFALLGVLLYTAAYLQAGETAVTSSRLQIIIAAAFALGTAIEVAQVFVGPHRSDLTDILIYTGFAASGALGSQWIAGQQQELRAMLGNRET